LNAKAIELKNKIETGEVTEATLTITTATSEVADDNYNLYLGIRRGHSILRHFLNLLIASDSSSVVDKKWITPDGVKKTQTLGAKINLPLEFTFKDLGFSKDGKLNVKFTTNGENTDISNPSLLAPVSARCCSLCLKFGSSYPCQKASLKLGWAIDHG
jgi:hypothetical protein